MSKKIIKFLKKSFVVSVGLVTVLSSAGPFLFWPSIASAVADTVAPNLDHWGVMQFDGDADATTTAYIFTFAADNVAVPGTDLIVDAFYQNAGWAGWSQSVCSPQYTDSNLYKCAVGLSPSATEGRSLKYYLRAFDGANVKFASFATDLTATSTSIAAPIAASIYNTPPWTNTISGAYTTSTIAWTGVKDGRCTTLALGAETATSSIYVSESAARANGLGMTPDDWILLGNMEKFQILATSTLGSYLRVDISGYTNQPYGPGSCVNEFIAGATVWISGTAISATSSDINATSTFGNFTLSNVPDGTFDVVAYKKNYCDGRQGGNSVSGGSTMPVSFMMPYGNCMGGGDMTNLNVIYTAPNSGATSAPIDIGLSGFPIMVGFSKNASSTTLTPANILLKKAEPDGSMALFASYYAVAYEEAGGNVTINGNAYDFGPDAHAIIYSTTTLATSSSYVVRLTSDIKDASGNSLVGNDPQGGHSFNFNTGGFFEAGMMTTANFGQGGGFMPPFVMNASPGMGKMGVPTSTKMIIEFDQSMTANGAVLLANVQLWQLNSSFAEVSQVSITANVSQTQPKILTITPASNLSASTRYRIKIKGGMQSSSGVTMAPPGSSDTMFTAEFQTGAAATATTLAVVGSNLDRYKNTAGAIVAVPTGTSVKVSFSTALDPATVNTNTAYLRVKGSTTNITASAQYDLMGGKIIFIPDAALNATTTYVLYLTAGIKDFTSTANTLVATTIEFTTGGADVEAPKLQFFNSDDYSTSITFSKSMNAASVSNTNQWPSGKSKWATSILNPANYVFYVDNGPPPSGSTVKYFGCNNLAGTTTECNTSGTANLNFAYDTLNNTVKVTGLKMRDPGVGLSFPGGVRVWVNNVTDISGNEISDSNGKTPPNEFGLNSMGGPLMNSSQTFGMMGPGGGMMGPPPTAGVMTNTDFGGKNPAMMGMMPVNVRPMNMVAGATSIYMIDLPITAGMNIPAGGKIVIGPFPDDANVSGAKNADINSQFAHYDINGPGPGKVVLGTAAESPVTGGLNSDGVTVSGQVVTVSLGAVPTNASGPDFIHLELDGIANPAIPSQGGFKISIQTQDSSGRTLESNTSMPFFVMPKGKYYIVGHATSTPNTGLNAVQILGGAPSTGPLFTTTANNAFGSSTDGEFQIAGLNSGNVMLMTESSVTVGAVEYSPPVPEPIYLNDTTTANSPSEAMYGVTGCTSATACYYYKKFTLSPMSAATSPALTVKIIGNFAAVGAGGLGTSVIDIFAGGPNGFRVKALTLNQDYSAGTTTTLYLPGTGDFNIGIGPSMPKGPMGMASAPMPTTWMPPKNANINVSGSAGAWVWTENSATPNDGIVQFTIPVADKTISGHVYDSVGTAVSNAEVFAYSPTEMFGTNTHVNQDGSFTLKVKEGAYKVGAFLPGAPPSGEIGVQVKSDGTVYKDGALSADVILKISKSIQAGYTISGTVYSDTGSQYTATDASVYAYRTDGPGRAETMTNSNGAYTLYVGTGTWKVGAYLASCGKLTEVTVVVAPSKSSVNFAPSSSVTYVTIRERVWQDANNNGTYDDGEGVSKANVSVVSTSTDYVISATTDTSGIYEVKVPGSTVYDIETWSPDIGSLAPLKNLAVTTSDIIYTSFSGFADIATAHTTTVDIVFYAADGTPTTVDKVLVQLDATDVAGVSNDAYKENVGTTTLMVASSTSPYIFDIEIQGIPKNLLNMAAHSANTSFGSTTVGSMRFATTTVNGYERINVTLPAITYISGQVFDSSGTAVPNAVLHIEQPGTDIEFDVETDTSGNYSFRVASSTTPYLIQADKGGYIDTAISVYASTSGMTMNPVMMQATSTISGTIILSGAAPGTSCYIWAERLGGGYVSNTGDCNSSTGAFSIKVIDGNWQVFGIIEGYSQAMSNTIAQVNGANVSGVAVAVSAATLSLEKQETLGMTGTVGGQLKNKNSGFEMNVPRSTISASDSSSYNVNAQEISNVPAFTPTGNLVGNSAEDVSAYKMSGSSGSVSSVSGLNGAAFIDKIFTKAALAAEGIDTIGKIEQVKMGTYDDSVQNWSNLPTTITYLNSSDVPVIPTVNLSNVAKVVFNGVTKHFSKIGVINTVYDGLPPAAPANVTATSEPGRVKVTWLPVTLNVDGTTSTDIFAYSIYRSTSPSDIGSWTLIGSVAYGTNVYYDPAPAGTTSYYRVTANTGLQSDFSTPTSGAQPTGSAAGRSIAYAAPSSGTTQTTAETTTETAAVAEEPAATGPLAQAETTVPAAAQEPVVSKPLPVVTFEKPISQMTSVEIAAKISEILSALETLKTMLQEVQAAESSSASIPVDYQFAGVLKYGQTSADIEYLQVFLQAQGEEIYPEGIISGWFGPKTKAAVIRFQEKYASEILAPLDLTEGTGLAGKATITKINEILGR